MMGPLGLKGIVIQSLLPRCAWIGQEPCCLSGWGMRVMLGGDPRRDRGSVHQESLADEDEQNTQETCGGWRGH